MKIITADYILTSNDRFEIIENGAIVFDKKIKDIGTQNFIFNKYKNLEVIKGEKNSCLMAGMINLHTHLEFSGNKTTLKYGNFTNWLNSVIKNRDDLIEKCKDECYKKALNKILKTGTTFIGATSSYGFDLNSCVNSDLKVMFFNEVIGSKGEMVDLLYQDFLNRYENSKRFSSDKFFPSIAIHSPYSVHPILIKKVLEIVKDENLLVSTHFLESEAELDWLNTSAGELKGFFNNFLNQKESLTTPIEFLKLFRELNTIYIHSVMANNEELKEIKNQNNHIIHCPVSNRLLNNNSLDLNNLKNINLDFALATDGLSSNNSLSLFEEMRSSLFIHTEIDVNELAKQLILSVTNIPAKIVNKNIGSLEIGKCSDFIILNLPDKCDIEDLATQVILHTKFVKNLFIDGKQIF